LKNKYRELVSDRTILVGEEDHDSRWEPCHDEDKVLRAVVRTATQRLTQVCRLWLEVTRTETSRIEDIGMVSRRTKKPEEPVLLRVNRALHPLNMSPDAEEIQTLTLG
jgi:hypothetical protein